MHTIEKDSFIMVIGWDQNIFISIFDFNFKITLLKVLIGFRKIKTQSINGSERIPSIIEPILLSKKIEEKPRLLKLLFIGPSHAGTGKNIL